MRDLTPTECRVLQSLLSTEGATERLALDRSEVPRSTYQSIRRRAILSGWIYPRYVPDPRLVERSGVIFRLIEPFAEHHAAIIELLRQGLDVVVMWSSSEIVFTVEFVGPIGADSSSEQSLGGPPIPAEWCRRRWDILSRGTADDIPVYFDYEGAWSKKYADGAYLSYPQRLPEGLGPAPRVGAEGLHRLLAAPSDPEWSLSSRLKLGSFFLPPRERRLLRDGWVGLRFFPDLARVPPGPLGRDESAAFVIGRLRTGRTVRKLVADLATECSSTPALAVQGSGLVLLAMLSPAPVHVRSNRGSVLATLQESLEEIEVIREPIQSLTGTVQHRYDRLVTRGLHRPDR